MVINLGSFLLKIRNLPSKFLQRHFYFFKSNFKNQSATKKPSVCFIDLDGTLWPDKIPNQIMKIGKPSREASFTLNYLRAQFDYVIAVSNQTIHAKSNHFGFLALVRYLLKLLSIRANFLLDGFLICHHHQNAQNLNLRISCPYRKPFHRMLADFELKMPFDKSKSIMIGDRLSDVAVGNFCGLRQTYLIVADYSLEKIVSDCSWPDTFFFTPIRTIGEVVEFEIGI